MMRGGMMRGQAKAGNLATTLPRGGCGRPMAQYDRLPAELRLWLAGAALPWSAASALRLWRRALCEAGGDISRARARLDRAEAQMLTREAAQIWGAAHPLAAQGMPGAGR